MFYELLVAFEETLFMVLTSATVTLFIGLPLGILLYLLSYQKTFWKKTVYRILKALTKMGSLLPYLVLVILLIPLTKILFGSQASVIAAIISLSLAALFPFAAEIQKNLNTLPENLQDLGRSLGASRATWTLKVGLKEILPKMIQQYAHHINQLMGYSIIAGVFGAGGLGGLLIEKGYHHFQPLYVLACLGLLLLLMQGVKFSLQHLTNDYTH